MSVKDALEMAKKNKVEIVDLKFVDFPGLWQHFSIPAGVLKNPQSAITFFGCIPTTEVAALALAAISYAAAPVADG